MSDTSHMQTMLAHARRHEREKRHDFRELVRDELSARINAASVKDCDDRLATVLRELKERLGV